MIWTAKFIDNIFVITGTNGEEAGAVIEVIPTGDTFLYEIPQYGGKERYSGKFTNVHKAAKVAESWA